MMAKRASAALRGLVVLAVIASSFLCPAVRAQSFAVWQGGSGSWSNASQWQCVIPPNPNPGPCVPNGNFNVGTTTGGGTINVDVGVNVLSVGLGDNNLVLDGTSIITPQGQNGDTIDAGGLQATGATITGSGVGFSGSSSLSNSTINASFSLQLAPEGSLQLSNSTINGPASGWDLQLAGSSAFDSSQLNGDLQGIQTTGSLSISNMTVSLGANQCLNVCVGDIEVDNGLTLNNATIAGNGANITLGGGASNWFTATISANGLAMDGTIDSTLGTITAPLVIVGNTSTGTMSASSTTINTDTLVLGESPGSNGQLTLGGLAFINLGNLGAQGAAGSIGIGDAGNGTLIVQGGVINSLVTSVISIGTGTSGPSKGQMSILEGGQVNVTAVLVGFGAAGSTASLTIDGSGSQLNLSGQGATLSVGGGTVALTNAASVNGGYLSIDQGQVTLGSGSTWTVTGGQPAGPGVAIGFAVPPFAGTAGSTGVASLTVSGGSTGSNTTSVMIGTNAGSNGTMTVTDEGSKWASAGAVIVGYQGTGTLNIQAGGVLTSGPGNFELETPDTSGVSANVGQSAGSTGTVTIDGEGSAWNQTGGIHVGDAGTGTLTVSNGGELTTVGDSMGYGGVIGVQSTGQGTVTLTGESSTWTTSGSVVVGAAGTGTLNIQDNAVLTSAPDGNGVSGYIGQLAGGTGTVTIDGGDSAWNQSGAIHVGDAGVGTLTIQNGGALTTDSDGSNDDLSGVIGVQSGSQGTVTIKGDDSKWEAEGNIQVGAAGVGVLNIQDQAEMSADSMSIGTEAGGKGTVAMEGGTLDLSGDLVVGDAGTATLTVVPSAPDDEGDITSKTGAIGAQAGSSGQVTIGSAVGTGMQATSSQWTIQEGLVVGDAGSGVLTLGGTLTDLDATLGQKASGNGTVEVQNGGMWTTTNDLTIGDQGIGRLTIDTGGFVNLTVGSVTLGNQLGSSGKLDVQGQLNIISDLVVGANGAGTMTIESGGAVASTDGHIAENALSTGTVDVTGAKSSWGVDGTLYVGQGGNGTLTVSNGGQVLSRDGVIGQSAGSVGTATITGQGSEWSATLSGGTGTIAVGGGGSTGALNVQDGGEVKATSVAVNSGGTLNGQGGTIAANVVNNGGTVTPGDATGIMTVIGNYTQNSGITLIEIDGGGAGQFDQLNVSGDAAFNGGALDIDFGPGFDPTQGETFDLVTASALSNLGVTVDVTGLPSGFSFTDQFTATGFDLTTKLTSGGGGGSPTPEPPSWLLYVSGLLSVGLLRRRIRSSIS